MFTKSLSSALSVLALSLTLSACANTNTTSTTLSSTNQVSSTPQPVIISSPAPLQIAQIKPTQNLVNIFEALSKNKIPTGGVSNKYTLQVVSTKVLANGNTQVELEATALTQKEKAQIVVVAATQSQLKLKEAQALWVEKTERGYTVWADKQIAAVMVKPQS